MSPRRGAVRQLALVVAAGSIGIVMLPTGAAAGAPERQASGETFTLVDQRFAVAADGDLRLVYRLDGDLLERVTAPPETVPTSLPPDVTTTTAPNEPADEPADEPATEPAEPADELRVVVVNYEPLTAGAVPARYVGDDARTARSADAIDGIVIERGRELLEIADDGTATLAVTVGTDRGESVEDRLRFDDPGLYPVVVTIVDGDGEDGEVLASHATLVQRLPDPLDRRLPSTDLALAVAIGEIGPAPTDAELATARRQLDAALALTGAIESPVTLSVPPVLLDAAADPDPDALAEALVDDRLLSVPLAPLDVSAAAAADVTDVFARRLREGEDLLTAAVPTNVARRDVWIATQPLSAAGAQVVRDLGFRYVVMTPALFSESVGDELPASDLFVTITLPDGGTLPLLVVDDLGEQLTTEATDAVLADRTALEWAVITAAEIILGQQRNGDLTDRSLILSTPDLTAPDPRLIQALERLVETTPSIRFTEAGNLPGVTDVRRVDGDEVEVQLPSTAGIDLSERVERLDATAVAMLSAGSMLPADDPRPNQWAARISDLISTGYSAAEVERTLADLLATAEELKDSVVPPDPFSFTLTGRSGDIDLRLTNTADEPLTVLVRLSSPKLAFPEGEQLVELRPNEQTLLAVPVRARTNGTSSVRVQLLTPAGETIHDPVVLTSRVNALTGFGQVLTGGLILVLLTWWFSHWRGRRRAALDEPVATVPDRQPSAAE